MVEPSPTRQRQSPATAQRLAIDPGRIAAQIDQHEALAVELDARLQARHMPLRVRQQQLAGVVAAQAATTRVELEGRRRRLGRQGRALPAQDADAQGR